MTDNTSKKAKEELYEQGFHKARRLVVEKNKKAIQYGEKVFDSRRSLAKFLNIAPPRITELIKNGSYKGIKVKSL